MRKRPFPRQTLAVRTAPSRTLLRSSDLPPQLRWGEVESSAMENQQLLNRRPESEVYFAKQQLYRRADARPLAKIIF